MKQYLFISAFIILGIASCTKENNSILDDKNFVFSNVKSTTFTNNFFYDKEDYKLYPNSNKKETFVFLDSVQKTKILSPIIDIESDYIVKYMQATFLSKQETIFGLTPIIVLLEGDDYSYYHYILLNKKEKVISSIIVKGEFSVGPGEINDSVQVFEPIVESTFKKDTIITTKKYEFHNFIKDQTLYFDSLTFQTIISKNGKLNTQIIDSVRIN